MSVLPEMTQRSTPQLTAHWLGRLPYRVAYDIQRMVHEQRYHNYIGDKLLLLEHEPVFTIPRRSQQKNRIMPDDYLRANGFEIQPTNRGGEITLHNPGQLTGYLICKLDEEARDLHSFIRWIEESLIEACKQVGVITYCRKGLTGTWIDNRKIASIGLAVKKWITLHGFALNVNNDLTPFTWINPCGLTGIEMTSIAREKGYQVIFKDVMEAVVAAFGARMEVGFPITSKSSES